MRNKVKCTVMALAVAGFAVPMVSGQDSPRPERGGRGERPVPPLVAALDANKDGTLDKTEITGATDALKKLDKDGDGKLTMGEIRGAQGRGARGADAAGERPRGGRSENEERAGERPRAGAGGERAVGAQAFITVLDANKNGTLDADELTGAPAALLKLDKNSDGQLTREELQMSRPGGAGGRGGADGERPNREGRGSRGDQNSGEQPKQKTPQ